MKRTFAFIGFLILNINLHAQTNVQSLIDSSINAVLLFDAAKPTIVYVRPRKPTRLKVSDTCIFFRKDFRQEYHYDISPDVLRELILNSKRADTTLWLSGELQNCILVSKKEDLISFASIKKTLDNSIQLKAYKKKIKKYNNTIFNEKDVFEISKPVFDNSKQFAIVEINDSHGGFGGGGTVTLFHFDGKCWQKIGFLSGWQY